MTGLWRSLMDAASGWNTLAIFLRLVLAMLSGMAVGIDRGLKRRGAGVKTHVLVCLGSALVMMTSEYMVYAFPGEKLDLARLGARS
ncbi:MgtC/SapB family protein [Clostridium sp. OF09-36]|uniref:MgtC/SapB family protein n=1 Tax=Clostridium sp. OF09-36 TaxID=2292310 RepID=UPI00242ABCCA|nr:MgtC/SapB family protein [Clostridium sp. OF09-36]